jgi:hypothetical protein
MKNIKKMDLNSIQKYTQHFLELKGNFDDGKEL